MAEAATGTFLDQLNEAQAIVRRQYPQAQLYEASVNLALVGSGWRFVFNDPATVPNSTIFLKQVEGRFGTPEHIRGIWVEDRPIELPITLDLAEAERMCQQGGCIGKISNLTLRYPLGIGVNEPYYIITMASENKRCWVGVDSRSVSCQPL